MLTFFFISVLVIAILGFGIYLWSSSSSVQTDERVLQPAPDFRVLFSPDERAGKNDQLTSAQAAEIRSKVLDRAAAGEREALLDAVATKDPQLYNEALNTLVQLADSEPKLLSLASYVLSSEELRVNAALAQRVRESWKLDPTRGGTSKMLHITARADDAKLLEESIETAVEIWRTGRIPNLSATELLSLCNGEYWTLSLNERNSGAGFMLKRTLARCQRELQPATNQ